MTKKYEQKFFIQTVQRVKKMATYKEQSITQNYIYCYEYLNELIDSILEVASPWLIESLIEQRDFYGDEYLRLKNLRRQP